MEIHIPEDYNSDTRMVAVDTHTDISSHASDDDSDVLMVSTDSINEESNNYLSRKDVLICQDFISSPNPDDWLHCIPVKFSKDGETQNTFTIQMKKINSSSNGFSRSLTSSNGDVMDLHEGVLKPNSNGERGDLNLTTLIFVFLVAGRAIENGSKDTAIKKSVKTFRQNILS